jgi:hypothetical protein
MVGTHEDCHSFLDELPEFGSRVLEVLRQPLEDKTVSIARSSGTLNFPANFMLIIDGWSLTLQSYYRITEYADSFVARWLEICLPPHTMHKQ